MTDLLYMALIVAVVLTAVSAMYSDDGDGPTPT